MNAAEHIDTAKAAIARGKTQDATAHALIAIAELMATNLSSITASTEYCRNCNHLATVVTEGDWPRCADCGLRR